jgi:hypothetical protein
VRRASLAVLVAAPILVLVSLYMPWRETSCAAGDVTFFSGDSAPSAGLQNLLVECSYRHIDGWSSVGDVAALSAILLALATVGGIGWPSLWRRMRALPLALVLVYFVVAVAAQTRLESHERARRMGLAIGEPDGVHYHVAYGTYVGLAFAALALLGAALARHGAFSVRPPVRHLCAAAVATGFLVALLLPWQRAGLPSSVRVSELGVAEPSGAIAAVSALGLLLAAWTNAGTRALERVGLALATLLFAGAAVTVGFGSVRAYGAWVGLGLAVLAVLVVLADRSLIRWIELPSAYTAAAAIAGGALVSSLFLPWQTVCYGNTFDLRSLGVAGRCVSSNGLGVVGSVAAALTIGLVVAVAVGAAGGRLASKLELATGVGLLVVTLGFRLEIGSLNGVRFDRGYGSTIGFVAGALLLALVVFRLRWSWPNLRSATPRLLPLALGVVYVAAVVVPWWGVLPDEVWSTFRPSFVSVSWLTITSALLGVRLVFVWARQAGGGADHGPELVVLSSALVVLAVLDAVSLPTAQRSWNGGVLIGLTLPLVLFALIEERGGLRDLHVPEILRVDRI